MDFKATLNNYQIRVEQGINIWTPSKETKPAHLHSAMRYSLEAGGKRLRPVLVIATAELFETSEDPLPAAIALECIHTYSLIHDDLPSIDDSDLRRGKPTCHKAFDEPTALLAGDALLTLAFEIIARSYNDSAILAKDLILDLSTAAGSQRLIGGQMEDILGEKSDYTADQLDYIHLNKTAALITVAMTMGARLGNGSEKELGTIKNIGRHVGLAFQITDDILDATSDNETLGKPTRADEEHEKTTYVKLYGLEGARNQAKAHTASASNLCAELNRETEFLEALIQYLEHRIS
ncbi:MAG: polyprenyl synthetase family protein [Verrucomicrobia bacterium]|nr:polyprenyl synthetase family protein [Verrucomicrobiota bacterium]MDA1066733.1 polyprenyl synthetase family protein [Verrucomicrobiota bacterium]